MEASSEWQPSVAIIGSGISGICAFVQLQHKLGITAQVYEANKDIGGTWFQNTYPGCRCDIASHLYSYSFDLNPDWSQTFSSQAEILHYLKHVCRKNDMLQHVSFETKVVRAVWLQEKRKWRLELKKLRTNATSVVYYDIVFSATGSLRAPNIPELFSKFTGDIVHTANWDPSLKLRGKRIALVGSGSSAVQILPHISLEASQLTVYQRSSPWILPQITSTIPDNIRRAFCRFPLLMVLYRMILFWLYDIMYIALGYPKSLAARYFSEKISTENKETLLELGRVDLAKKVLPTYPIGCKRVVYSTDYYQTLARPNVRLVDEPIKEISSGTHIMTRETSTEVDLIILATGFNAAYNGSTSAAAAVHFIGKDNQSLTELWQEDRPQLFKSTTIHGFPNLFMLLGPYTTLGHSSLVFMAEKQVEYAIRCIQELVLKNKHHPHGIVIEPTKVAQKRYMKKIVSNLGDTTWSSSACNSWYKNAKGQLVHVFPSAAFRFALELRHFNRCDYM